MTSVVTRAATASDAAFLVEHDHVRSEVIMEQIDGSVGDGRR